MNHDAIKPYGTEANKKAEVATMFDNIAPKYDFLNRIFSLRIDTLWRKKLISILQKHQPKRILDVATGTADLAIAAAAIKPDKIQGIDISKEMIAQGEKKVLAKNLQNIIQLNIGDAENIQFEDASFDAITVAFGVRNFENLDKGLQEMRRVLKKDGVLLILEFSNPHNVIIRWLYYFYFCNVLPKIGAWVSKDARAYSYLPESAKAFPSGEKMKKILLDNGYKNVTCTALTFGISTIYTAYH